METIEQDSHPNELAIGTLYVVATPIGNLRDIGLRALDTLRAVDVVAAEDTRHTRRLLEHYGLRKELLAVHEHNEAAGAHKVIGLLGEGKRVALVSDAGTPAVSDPGARCVAAVREAGFAVVPVPGPSAVMAAISAAGLEESRFLFCGFLPPKAAARRQAITQLRGMECALVLYEAPHRIEETVADLAAILQPERHIVIARELTKLFESIVRLRLPEAPAWLAADATRRRGEFVLLISGPHAGTVPDAEAVRVLRLLLAEMPLKSAVKLAAEITGKARNDLYRRALEWTKGQ